jgi:hypothetical protein
LNAPRFYLGERSTAGILSCLRFIVAAGSHNILGLSENTGQAKEDLAQF